MDARVALSCTRGLGEWSWRASPQPLGVRSGMLTHGMTLPAWAARMVRSTRRARVAPPSIRARFLFFARGLEAGGAALPCGPGRAIRDADAQDVAACTVTEGARQVHGAPSRVQRTRARQFLARAGRGDLRSPCSPGCGVLTRATPLPAWAAPKCSCPANS